MVPAVSVPGSAGQGTKRPLDQAGAPDAVGLKRPFESFQLTWVEVNGRPMASVSALLTAISAAASRKAKAQIGERLQKWWPKKFRWDLRDLSKHGSAASRQGTGGGLPGHMAAESVLRDIYSLY